MIHYNKRFIIYYRFLTIYLKAISTLQTNIKIKHINYILRLNVLKITENSSNLKEYLFLKIGIGRMLTYHQRHFL